MDIDVLKSYLVNLGFSVDQNGLKKFDQGLKDAAGMFQTHTTGFVADVLKWQVAITGAFTGIAGGVIGMAEHVADADQQYRLFGERMFMTTDSARKLQQGMKLLGADMNEIAADPELHARFLELSDLQDQWTKKLGTNFEDNMRGVRDLDFELTKLKLGFMNVERALVSALYDKLKPILDQVKEKGEQWIDSLVKNLPKIVDWVGDRIVPVFEDLGEIFDGLVDIGGELLGLFQDIVGVFTDDESLKDAPVTFDSIAHAIDSTIKNLALFLNSIELAEKGVVHFARGIVDEIGAAVEMIKGLGKEAQAVWALVHGDTATAGRLAAEGVRPAVKQAVNGFTQMGQGGVDLASAAAPVALIGNQTKEQQDAAVAQNKDLTHITRFFQREKDRKTTKSQALTEDQQATAAEIAEKAAQAGIDPEIAKAVAMQESGMHQYDKNGNVISPGTTSALGLFQLTRAAAHDQHVDASDPHQNISGGVSMLAGLMKHYNGNQDSALAAYYWGQGNVDKALKRHQQLPDEVLNYVRGVREKEGQSVTIGDIQISIAATNLTPDQLQKATTDGVTAALKKQTQRSQAQLAFAG